MKLTLVDTNADLVAAWKNAFSAFPAVAIREDDLLAIAENTVVSPANSFGFLDGGIDKAYLDFFGSGIQSKVQDAIARRPEGRLPVGASLVVRTGHSRIPYLIVAPTMLLPEAVEKENCYRAMRAVLRVAAHHEKVFCPGLGTGVGTVSAEEAAREMAQAYADAHKLGSQ